MKSVSSSSPLLGCCQGAESCRIDTEEKWGRLKCVEELLTCLISFNFNWVISTTNMVTFEKICRQFQIKCEFHLYLWTVVDLSQAFRILKLSGTLEWNFVFSYKQIIEKTFQKCFHGRYTYPNAALLPSAAFVREKKSFMKILNMKQSWRESLMNTSFDFPSNF